MPLVGWGVGSQLHIHAATDLSPEAETNLNELQEEKPSLHRDSTPDRPTTADHYTALFKII
jgi:hypothetical protein